MSIEPVALRSKISDEFSKLQHNEHEAFHDPTVWTAITEAKKSIIEYIDNQSRFITLPQATKQTWQAKLGGFLVYPDERAGYFLALSIKSVIGIPLIQEALKERFGINYPKVMDRFNKYFVLISKINNLRDDIRNDPAVRTNPSHPKNIQILNHLEKIHLVYANLFSIFHCITQRTNLGQNGVDSQYIQIYREQYKHLEYKQDSKKTDDITEAE
jgi:hypothetical protein